MYRQGDALIRYHYHIDPEKLELDEWSKAVNDILYVMEMKKNMMASIFSDSTDK